MKRFTPAGLRFLAALAIAVGTASGALLQAAEAAHFASHAACRKSSPPGCACRPGTGVRAVTPAAPCPLCAVTARGCDAAPVDVAPPASAGEAVAVRTFDAGPLPARFALLLPPALGPPAGSSI